MKNKTIISTILALSMSGISFATDESNPTIQYEVCSSQEDCYKQWQKIVIASFGDDVIIDPNMVLKKVDDFDNKTIISAYKTGILLNKSGGYLDVGQINLDLIWNSATDKYTINFICQTEVNIELIRSVDILIDGEKTTFNKFGKTTVWGNTGDFINAPHFIPLSYINKMMNGKDVKIRINECNTSAGVFSNTTPDDNGTVRSLPAKESFIAILAEVEKSKGE